jgi:GNAT superfamily N-acetyltransferase
MTNIIHFEPLTTEKYSTYITVGTKAYNQHYLHLWPDGDSSSYIQNSFTNEVLKKETSDANTHLFIIHLKKSPVGILKFTQDKSLGHHSREESLYVDKIYILKEATGMGIGKKVLQFIRLRAEEIDKKLIWLDTMQKGPALNFYLKNGFEMHGETKVPFENALEEERPMYVLKKWI